MQTITLEITHTNARKALQALAEKHFIKIIEEFSQDSPAFDGKLLHMQAFKSWIAHAENSNTVSLTTAKSSWQAKRKLLQQLVK